MENKLVKGAKIATIGLFITKILGIVYVIPMNRYLSDNALALYGISFLIYAYFTQIALAGFPVGISKLVAKYRSEGNYTMVNKLYKYTHLFVSGLSLIAFIILFFGTDLIIKISDFGRVLDVNELNITLKILAVVLLVLPSLSISRGYIQGFEDMVPTSKSIIIEQVIRVAIIIFAVTVIKNLVSNGDTVAVYISTLASFIGAVISLLALVPAFKKYYFNSKRKEKSSDLTLSFKQTIKAIAIISIPFIILSIFGSSFDAITATTIPRVLNFFGFSDKSPYSLSIISIYTIHIQKLMLIVLTVSSGFTMSLIPSITALATLNKFDEMKRRITQLLLLALFVTGFLTVMTAIFNYEYYFVFFGYYKYGGPALSVSIVGVLFYALYNVLAAILLSIDKVKIVFISFIIGIGTKFFGTILLTVAFKALGIEASLTFAYSSLLGFFISFIYLVYKCIKIDIFDIKDFMSATKKIALSLLIITILAYVLKLVLPNITASSGGLRDYITNVFVLITSGLICLTIYIISADKLSYLEYVSGTSLSKLKGRIRNAIR